MHARPWPWEVAAAALAGAVFAAAVAFAGRDPAVVAVPGGSSAPGPAGAVPALQAPPVGSWEEWWSDDSNPFVPWRLRQQASRPGGGAVQPLPPHGQADVPVPPAPPLALPGASQGGGGAPRAVGCQRVGGRVTGVLLRFPGSTAPRLLAVGGTQDGWTVLAVETGGVVRCRAPDGREHHLLIGE